MKKDKNKNEVETVSVDVAVVRKIMEAKKDVLKALAYKWSNS